MRVRVRVRVCVTWLMYLTGYFCYFLLHMKDTSRTHTHTDTNTQNNGDGKRNKSYGQAKGQILRDKLAVLWTLSFMNDTE